MVKFSDVGIAYMGNGTRTVGVNEERDEDSGKFASKYTDQDFLNAIQELGGAAGTADIADAVGCPRRTAYNRLDNLREEGTLETREVGSSLLWMLTDDE